MLKNIRETVLNPEFYLAVQEVISLAKQEEQETALSLTIPCESIDPLAALEILGTPGQFQFYWEHPDEKTGIAAGECLHRLNISDEPDRFMAASAAIQQFTDRVIEYSTFRHTLAGVHFLGGFSFFEKLKASYWKDFKPADFIIPEWTLIKDGELTLITVNILAQAHSVADDLIDSIGNRIAELVTRLLETTSRNQKTNGQKRNVSAELIDIPGSLDSWQKSIREAQSLMDEGHIQKIVLSRVQQLKLSGSQQATRILNQLRHEYPSCYTFMINPGGEAAFLGSTPERLISIRSNYILTEGLAGSISRGDSATEDAILEKKLLNSDKDLEEHRLVVEMIVRKLQRFSDDVNYPAKPGIKKFSNVQHLYTPISAWTSNRYNPFSIIKYLHPTPAVGGVPTDEAISLIPRFEEYDRGWYAAPFGWINSKGRGEFVVAIRSGLLLENEALFFAGCGIVPDSDPVSEWEETNLKLIPMISAISHA
ncbi:MAG: isochorismate synthase [Balneolales bacterium]|nr:isochorismate synthase [Balneolales bacterium]